MCKNQEIPKTTTKNSKKSRKSKIKSIKYEFE